MADVICYVVVADATDIVENVTVWDGQPGWAPPAGMTAYPFPDGAVSPGWTWNNGKPQPPVDPQQSK